MIPNKSQSQDLDNVLMCAKLRTNKLLLSRLSRAHSIIQIFTLFTSFQFTCYYKSRDYSTYKVLLILGSKYPTFKHQIYPKTFTWSAFEWPFKNKTSGTFQIPFSKYFQRISEAIQSIDLVHFLDVKIIQWGFEYQTSPVFSWNLPVVYLCMIFYSMHVTQVSDFVRGILLQH